MSEYENECEAQMEMPRYKCHKQVWALKIAGLKAPESQGKESDGSLIMEPAERDYANILLSPAYVAKHRPHVGGYFVVYKDGYQSFSPAKAFEDGYSRA